MALHWESSMHEIGIASSVLDVVRGELKGRPGSRAVKVGLRIGMLSGVDPEALRFAVETLVSGTELDRLALDMEFCPRRQRCGGCGHEFDVEDYIFACPECGQPDTANIGGDEMEVTFLEVEQP